MAESKKKGKKISEDVTILPPEGGEKVKKRKPGRPKSIKDAKDLASFIDKYFSSISYTVFVRREDGTILTDIDGEMLEKTVYVTPPDVMSLCLFLGISPSTWENYCDAAKYPDYAPICERARMKMEAYLREVLVTREKGSLQGVIFNLQNNYGWRDKKTVDLGDETVDALKDLSLSEKMAMVAKLKSGELDVPEAVPDEEWDDEDEDDDE